jgi:hypothetical protein
VNWLFHRSDRFLRAFDAACAVVFALLAWRFHSVVWAVSAVFSATLCVTNASVHLQHLVQRGLRSMALSLVLRKGA